MATRKPLRICVDRKLYDNHEDVFKKLRDVGHIVWVDDNNDDLFIGPQAHFMNDKMVDLLDIAVKKAQKRKYDDVGV